MKRIIHSVAVLAAGLAAAAFAVPGIQWQNAKKEEVAKVFGDMSRWYSATATYSVTVTHSSYRDYTAQTPADISKGYFKKDKENYHSFLLGIHTVQNKRYKVVVDTINEVIMISDPDKAMQSVFTQVDYEASLGLCAAVKEGAVENGKAYRVEFKESFPFTAYEVRMDNGGMMREMTLFYNRELPLNPDDKNSKKVKPRVSISLSAHNKSASFSYAEEFDESKYFIKKDNRYYPTDRYRKCKIMDLTVEGNKK